MAGRATVRGAREIRAQARAAAAEVELGQTVVLRDLADLFRKGERQIFRTYGSAINARWAPLKASTAKSRARLASRFGLQIGPRDPRLVLFGDLRAALTEEGGAHHVRIERRRVRVEVDQARINRHDRRRGLGMTLTKRGTRRKVRGGSGYPDNIIDLHEEGQGNVPPRKIIGIPPSVKARMDARAKKWFDSLARQLVGRGR